MTCKCKGLPIPPSFVKKDLSINRKKWFETHQLRLLKNAGYDEATNIELGANDFIAMLTSFAVNEKAEHLRVYFAAYSGKDEPRVPDGFENKMTLIFSPVLKDLDMPAVFYSVAPGGIFNPGEAKLPPDIAKEWIKNYETGQLVTLSKGVDEVDANRNVDAGVPEYSDTRSVVYDMGNLNFLKTEVSCQAASRVRIYFSSYLDTETATKYITPKRMVTQFELVDAWGNDFYIDDFDLSCRPKPADKSFDNGQLCPTYCPR